MLVFGTNYLSVEVLRPLHEVACTTEFRFSSKPLQIDRMKDFINWATIYAIGPDQCLDSSKCPKVIWEDKIDENLSFSTKLF